MSACGVRAQLTAEQGAEGSERVPLLSPHINCDHETSSRQIVAQRSGKASVAEARREGKGDPAIGQVRSRGRISEVEPLKCTRCQRAVELVGHLTCRAMHSDRHLVQSCEELHAHAASKWPRGRCGEHKAAPSRTEVTEGDGARVASR